MVVPRTKVVVVKKVRISESGFTRKIEIMNVTLIVEKLKELRISGNVFGLRFLEIRNIWEGKFGGRNQEFHLGMVNWVT